MATTAQVPSTRAELEARARELLGACHVTIEHDAEPGRSDDRAVD
jgi:hypothetical protein